MGVLVFILIIIIALMFFYVLALCKMSAMQEEEWVKDYLKKFDREKRNNENSRNDNTRF